jgi:hypothetical protein
MTVMDLLKKIKSRLNEQKATIANNMIDGRMSDYESYCKNVGIAEGLNQAVEIIDETLTKLDKEDE